MQFYSGIPQWTYALMLGPVFMLLVQIRTLKVWLSLQRRHVSRVLQSIAPTSLFANGCVFFAFVILYSLFT